MTFINISILFGLLAVSIPILIHLFNRRKARVVDWGAMQFLLGSLVNRKRRVLIEELILMALRCLLLAVIVLAVARPFSPINSGISWLVLLPVILIAAVMLAVATIMARRPAFRWLWIACAAVVVIGVVYLSQSERLRQAKHWKSATEQDVAIIIDGSSSMRVDVDGTTNFQRAVVEARRLIESLGPEDNVSFIIAGGVVENATPEALNVRSNRLEEVLSGLQPLGGELNVVEALSAAATALASGGNASKKVVLILDEQNVGWQSDNDGQWKFVADTLNYLPTKPKVVARFLSLPEKFQNATVASVDLSREVIGTDREVTIRVRVENTGFESIEPSSLQLLIDDDQVEASEVGSIKPGESTQLNFKYRFVKSGMHAIAAKLLVEDDLKEDNQQTRVAQVLETMPVLLVDGSGQIRSSEMASTFVEIALSPPTDEAVENGEANQVGKPLISTKVVAATELNDSIRFSDYRVVMLLDVPRVGTERAGELATFVRQGGGLLVAPGKRCDSEFYNNWKLVDGNRVMPAKLVKRVVLNNDEPTTRPVEESYKHPALARLISTSQTDMSKSVISAYWELETAADDPTVMVGGRLEGGEPFLVEKSLGRGIVAMTATSLDANGSDIASRLSFLPFIHELTYGLAAPSILDLNRQPEQILTIDLPPENPHGSNTQTTTQGTSTNAAANQTANESGEKPKTSGETAKRSLTVVSPSGEMLLATLEQRDDQAVFSMAQAVEPGVYGIQLDGELSKRFADASIQKDGKQLLPFTISLSEIESRLVPLAADQEAVAKRHLDYFRATNTEQMVAAVIGEVPGHELWKYLVIGAIVILLAESFAARWIAQQRKMGTAETVDFVSEGERLSTFQTRARELLETVRSK